MLGPHALDLPEALSHLELQRLAWLYCHAVDRGDMTLLRSLYHDDAIDDHGDMFSGSADDFVAWLPRALSGVDATRHTIESMLFVFAGDRAQGQLVNTAYHRTGLTEVIIKGRYLDTYARRDGIWRIQHRSLVMDALEHREASAQSGADNGVAWGQIGTQDPVYARLDLFA